MVTEIDEPVTLSRYDRTWCITFASENQAILKALRGRVVAIEHIGSTAIPGLQSKPVIDILAGFRRVPVSSAVRSALAQLGYEYLGRAGVPGRYYFRKRTAQAFNLAAVTWNGHRWKDNLLLRNYLLSHPEVARRYARVKRAAISAGATTLLDYSAYKSAFMQTMLREAKKSRHNRSASSRRRRTRSTKPGA